MPAVTSRVPAVVVRALPLFFVLSLLQPLRAAAPQEAAAPRVEALVREARAALEAEKPAEARAAVQRALERDPNNLDALRVSARIADAEGDADRAVHDRHRWLWIHDSRDRRAQDRRARRDVVDALEELDPDVDAFAKLQTSYRRRLERVAKDYEKRDDLLGAIGVWQQVLELDPNDREATRAIDRIRRTGGDDVAVEDVYAGSGDPTEGLSAEQLAAEDARHATWETAYEAETENYTYRTDAGRVVLETSQIAMEQMNRFYRRFFRFELDGGKTPSVEIRIFKDRDEYLELGSSPAKWSGGQFTGRAVETYASGGSSGDGSAVRTGEADIRSMYRTLFHEAAHQFVRLTGPFVPGWLNEAYASFFEGCTILSNGSVRWNGVPPGRLFPLAQRMEAGWMASPDEAAPDGSGDFPTVAGAPPFEMVVSGNYRWGPPWYAPTWGVVYFLYNYRDDDGRAVYRDALHEYYGSFERGRKDDPVADFERIVLAAPLSPVATCRELDPIWKRWILDLRDRETGRTKGGNRLVEWADKAVARGERELALEFLLEAKEELGDQPDLLWKIAGVLEDLGEKPRAAAAWRAFRRELELRGMHGDERFDEAVEKIRRLDPVMRTLEKERGEAAEKGLVLARGYEERGLPRMALEIARRVGARFGVAEALAYYADVARRTGVSLARWRVAYNERDLEGWSGGSGTFQAYGARIRSSLPEDNPDGEFATRQLACDVPFDADYSLEAELRIGTDGSGAYEGRLAGLCFGMKGSQDFHAVMLFPDGFLDVAAKRGGSWDVRDHRNVKATGGAWHRLRIDVTGSAVDVYLDGLFLRSYDFANPAVVRGGFGLIVGVGEATFRNIRILPRDPHDPAARIERELALEKVMADASLRQEGTFSGMEPPGLDVRWVQGERTSLSDLRGKPVVLVFWSPLAERTIPTADYVDSLIRRGADAGVEVVVVADSGTSRTELRSFLGRGKLVGARVGIDQGGTFASYYVRPGYFGMPRFLLLDRAGRVVFEGDPGLKSGEGWRPGEETYVDPAFERLLEGG